MRLTGREKREERVNKRHEMESERKNKKEWESETTIKEREKKI